MTRTITITIGWGVLAIAALAGVAIVTALTLDATVGPPPPDNVQVWPQVTRTINGTTTVVHPEDLDRTGQ